MDGGAYAPIVSRILKSGRCVGSDGEKVSAGAIGVESQYLWRKISVRSVGVGERRRFSPDAGNNRGLPPITSGKRIGLMGIRNDRVRRRDG